MSINGSAFVALFENPWLVFGALICATAVECIVTVVYRIFFHPLAHVPGPLLAKASTLYPYWYNFRGGRFYLQVHKLHGQHGPVVRIAPNEIHLSDPKNYEKVYNVGSQYAKPASFYQSFGIENAAFSTGSPDLHRARRAALNPFFSRRNVLYLEDIVHQKVEKLAFHMQSAFGTTGQIDLHYGFRAVSVDVISDYAFDNCFGLLDQPGFGKGFFEMIRGFGPATLFFQQFPTVRRMALYLPLWLAKLISAPLGNMLSHQKDSRTQVTHVKGSVDNGEKSLRTIFHQLLQPDAAEGHIVPTVQDLTDEAFAILGAAADTTGNALTIASYNIVANPDTYQEVTKELEAAFPDPGEMKFTSLEKLPYLTGVVKEALRLSFGVPGRLPRIVPQPGAQFNGYFVPEGIVVGMSSWTMHHNEEIFPNADTFDPTRWTNPATSRTLEKYLFSFGKGSRQCAGMQLAYCELYVTLGKVFRQFNHLKTRKKSPEELVYDDYFSGYHSPEHNEFIFEQTV